MKRDKSGKFQAGASGNPRGKPKGTLSKMTLAAQALLDGEAQALTRKCIDLALDGDLAAMKLCLARILPPKRENPVNFALPDTPNDITAMTWAILQAVAYGNLEPGQASAIGQLISAHCKAIELSEIEKRLSELEAQIERNGNQ